MQAEKPSNPGVTVISSSAEIPPFIDSESLTCLLPELFWRPREIREIPVARQMILFVLELAFKSSFGKSLPGASQ